MLPSSGPEGNCPDAASTRKPTLVQTGSDRFRTVSNSVCEEPKISVTFRYSAAFLAKLMAKDLLITFKLAFESF